MHNFLLDGLSYIKRWLESGLRFYVMDIWFAFILLDRFIERQTSF